jgi:hypothetical protein
MSHLYRASKAYQEQLLRDAQPEEAGSKVEPGQHRPDAIPLLKTLRALQQVRAIREGKSVPPAWIKT